MFFDQDWYQSRMQLKHRHWQPKKPITIPVECKFQVHWPGGILPTPSFHACVFQAQLGKVAAAAVQPSAVPQRRYDIGTALAALAQCLTV